VPIFLISQDISAHLHVPVLLNKIKELYNLNQIPVEEMGCIKCVLFRYNIIYISRPILEGLNHKDKHPGSN